MLEKMKVNITPTTCFGIRKYLFSTIVLIVLLLSCNQQNKTNSENTHKSKTTGDGISIVKNYHEGELQSEFSMKDSVKQGIGKIYYLNGKLSSVCNYSNDLKNGLEEKYYTEGTLYRTREYIDGKINGLEKRYYRNGQLKTALSYKNDMPGTGLKEYHRDGTIVTEYPELTYEIINDRDYKRQKLLIFYFPGITENVYFYQGQLIEGKYFDTSNSPCGINNGKGEIGFYPDSHGEITISAKYITSNLAPYVIEKKIIL